MKFKKCLIIWFAITMVLLCSCDYDPYLGKRPVDYDGVTWVSEGDGYRMSFTVGKMNDSVLEITGKEPVNFDLLWAMYYSTVLVYIYGNQEMKLFDAECEFGKKQFKMNIRVFCGVCKSVFNSKRRVHHSFIVVIIISEQTIFYA